MKNLPTHRNIVKLKKIIDTRENLYLVMEYASGGSLYEYIKKNKLDENTAREIFKQVFKAVEHCHEHGIVHR